MWPIISALFTGVTGSLGQAVKDYLDYKKQESQNKQEIRLAELNANKEVIISGNQSDTDQRANYLNSVTRNFRQKTFIFLMIPFLVSMIAPEYSKEMWHRFNDIPAEFKQLFFLIYGVIWGLPIAKENFGSLFSAVQRGLEARREYKINKIKATYNRKAVFDTLKALFPKGMNQAQVNLIDKALDAGEQEQ